VRRIGLTAVRYGIPLAFAIAGVVVLARGGDEAGLGVVLLGSGFLVLLINVLFRMSVVSNREREAEERARETFAREGRWPDEDQAASSDSSR
jgi:Na+-transporting methylmalonyl-CoA/oxaloacetate decarboxylase gamma subunit